MSKAVWRKGTFGTGGPTKVKGPIRTSTRSLSFGQAEYTTTGTFSWVAPAGVTSISVVAIGGGGAGQSGGVIANGYWANGGGGGGLGWKNNIAVTSGTSYTVVVGAAGIPNALPYISGTKAGNSYFSTSTLVAGFGASLTINGVSGNSPGGSYVGDGGGAGGAGGAELTNSTGGGGGGAGGYSGNGGNGADSGGNYGSDGTGGGGGGGGANGYVGVGTGYTGGGGGVGLYGQGTNGAGGGFFNYDGTFGSISKMKADGGKGGSGGGDGTGNAKSSGGVPNPNGYGGAYGGGGGGFAGPAGVGAVRIIWGSGISFPDNAA